MSPRLDLQTARDVAGELCDQRRVTLVPPTSLARKAVVHALAALHLLDGDVAWDAEYAQEHVSVTLPPAGPLLDALALIPIVGPVLRDVVRDAERTTIFLAPSADLDPAGYLATVAHELGHADQLAAAQGKGTLALAAWCVAYGAVPALRAPVEASCYGMDLAVLHYVGGRPVEALVAAAAESLSRYGLDKASQDHAGAILAVHARTCHRGGVPGGPAVDVIRALRARTYPDLPLVPT